MSFFAFLRANAPFLLVGVLLTFCSSFGQTFFISVFAGEIRAEFGLSHGDWGAVYSIGTLASAAVMVWAGGLTDRFRVRSVGPAVLGCLVLACVGMALTPNVALLTVAVFGLRFFGQGMSILISTVAMARWFVRSRGKALSVSMVGIEMGQAFLPMIFVAAMGALSWRSLWLVCALIVAAILPLLWPLLRLERTPQSIAAGPQGMGMGGREWRRPDMLRHYLYWLLIPALLGPAAFGTALFFHQVHLAETKGWEHLNLVTLFPVFTAAAIVSVFTSGFVIDRIGTARMMPLYQLPMAAGFVVFGLTDTLGGAAVALGLMGLSQGMNSTVPNAFWAEFYGTRHMGAIRALAQAVMVMGTAIGPALTGVLIDMGVPFEDQLTGIAVYFVLAAICTGIGIARAKPTLPRPSEA
ncbi:MFS transporter [Palleronia sediminis]|uniref:MFS transporter n=1 Tax=Palleronia sediminis TaxID=2547833 RepID=A0A4R6AB36_9RHOB|nr:MFS transporter [Palleronia sediminis]TDL78333.1 MFS transporter [Palleronia sediminis]